jgi:flagellar basal body rod protein FlgC
MDLSALDISAAGLRVQRARMDVIAGNLAHAEAPAAKEEAVRAEDGRTDVRSLPVRRRVASVVQGADGLPSLLVTEGGSVDPMVETLDLLAASRAYEANLTAVEVAKSMNQAALRILG